MAQFDLDAFLQGKHVEESSSGKPKLLFTVTDVVKVDKYEIYPDSPEEALVFKLKCEDGSTGEVAQGLNKQDGTRKKTMFWGYYWDEKNGKPRAGSVMQDMLMAVKEWLGEEEYKKRKEEVGGVNINFWKGVQFKATLSAGKTKAGKEYYIVGTPMRDKVNSWDYLVKEGHVNDYAEIEEVRMTFPDMFKYIEKGTMIETPEVENDDLPF